MELLESLQYRHTHTEFSKSKYIWKKGFSSIHCVINFIESGGIKWLSLEEVSKYELYKNIEYLNQYLSDFNQKISVKANANIRRMNLFILYLQVKMESYIRRVELLEMLGNPLKSNSYQNI